MKLKKLITAALLAGLLTMSTRTRAQGQTWFYSGWYYYSILGAAYILFGNPYCWWTYWQDEYGHGGYTNTCTGENYTW